MSVLAKRLDSFADRLDELLLADAAALRGRIRRMRERLRQGRPIDRDLLAVEKRFFESSRHRRRRAESLPAISYPDLPVAARRDDLLETMRDHPVVIVCGDTGSGKTTQLPKMLLELGRGVAGAIGCTQPRRLAAVSVARRVAEELGVRAGEQVGYQVRFDSRCGPRTLVKFMTDGILLAESQGDRRLWKYDALIIDEAHERSLNIDFLLGYLHDLRRARPDLKLVVSSATLDAEAFSRFFDGAPVVTVEGRTYPIEDRFLPPRNEDEDLHRHVSRAVDEATAHDPQGDVLVFLPGEREIRLAADLLRGRRLPGTEVLPLFARLGLREQQKVFQVGGRRRIVLATNVAETSLTIPGIRCVIDSGVARITGFNPRTRVQSLQVRPVSQASSRQRRGRCGRVGPGLCIRLFEEEDLAARPAFTPPEIRRSSLAGVILRMKALGLPDIHRFPFVDPPQKALVRDGIQVLEEIGALESGSGDLTAIGRELARFPIDPRIARMVLAARDRGVLTEVLVLAAGLSVSDVRERPLEKAAEADEAQARWRDERSDFMGLLRVWADLQEVPNRSGLRRFCRRHFLNVRRVFEWQNILRELVPLVEAEKSPGPGEPPDPSAQYDAIHRALLAGLPSSIGTREEERREYQGARDRRFHLHPGSGLFPHPPEWVVVYQLVETTKLYARLAAEFDPGWLETVAPHLCRSTYRDPAWNPKTGRVEARESVSCCGLQIVADRPADYGARRPAEAREVFLREALAPGRIASAGPWLTHHRGLLREIATLEQKLRRPHGLLDEAAVVRFFDERLPPDLCSLEAFEGWRRTRPDDLLCLRFEEATCAHRDAFSLEGMPDAWQGCELVYHCEPGEANDGITLNCSLAQLDRLPDWAGEWLVPAWLPEKVGLLLRALSRQERNALQPLQKAALEFVAETEPAGPLVPALCHFLRARRGLHLEPEAFDDARVPEHLAMRFCVRDGEGKPLALSRDLAVVRRAVRRESTRQVSALAPAPYRGPGDTEWRFGVLPDRVALEGGATGYPGLVDEGGTVALRLHASPAHARAAHRRGLCRLVRLQLPGLVARAETDPPLSRIAENGLRRLGPEPATNLPGLVDRALLQELGEPRDARGFERGLEQVRTRLFDALAELAPGLRQLVESWEEVSNRLEALRDDPRCRDGVADLDAQVADLFRPGFLRDRPIAEYPRWLDAMGRRLERLAVNPGKDGRKMARLEPFADAPEALFEMLQEFRVAVFAPEVGTRAKVSEKRIHERLLDLRGEAETPAPPPAAGVDARSMAEDLARAWRTRD